MKKYWPDALAVAILCFLIFQIWYFPWLPLQDYYDWVIQAKILFQIWQNDSFTVNYYYIPEQLPPPNSLFIFVLAVLQFIFPVTIAEKLILTLYVILFVYGAYRISIRENNQNPFRFLGLIVVFHCFFYSGFISFCFGLAILLVTLPVFSEKYISPYRKAVEVLGISLILYFIHAMVFGIFILAYILWIFRLNYKLLKVRDTLLFLLALLPSFILLGIFFLSQTRQPGALLDLYSSTIHWIKGLYYPMTLFPRFLLNKPAFPLSVLNALFIIAIMSLFYHQRKQLSLKLFPGQFFLFCLVLSLLSPIYRIGQSLIITSRFIPLVLILAGSAFFYTRSNRKLEISVLSLAVFLSVFHFLQFNYCGKQNKDVITDIREKYHSAASPLVIGKVYLEDFDRSPQYVLSGVTQPYIFIGSYWQIDSLHTFLSIQETSMIRMRKTEESRVKMRLDTLFVEARFRQQAVSIVQQYQKLIYQTYDHIFVFGGNESRIALSKSLYPYFTILKEYPICTILVRSIQNRATESTDRVKILIK